MEHLKPEQTQCFLAQGKEEFPEKSSLIRVLKALIRAKIDQLDVCYPYGLIFPEKNQVKWNNACRRVALHRAQIWKAQKNVVNRSDRRPERRGLPGGGKQAAGIPMPGQRYGIRFIGLDYRTKTREGQLANGHGRLNFQTPR